MLHKAIGLQESLSPTTKQVGTETLLLLNTLIEAIYTARGQPPIDCLKKEGALASTLAAKAPPC
ncbi:MAG: hypothetical protein QX195_04575 [Methylococcaceae bacterium]